MYISSETRLFIREHSTDDVRTLALQSKKYPDVDMPVAITQIAGRQIAAEKIPSWKKIEDIRYPKHLVLRTMFFGDHRLLQSRSPARRFLN